METLQTFAAYCTCLTIHCSTCIYLRKWYLFNFCLANLVQATSAYRPTYSNMTLCIMVAQNTYIMW